MFVQSGWYLQNVRIENDVVRWKLCALRQKFVSAGADVDLALKAIGLALFIEGHEDDRGAVSSNRLRLPAKFFLAVLQADRIDDWFALHAFETGLDHAPLGAVDH